MPTPCLRLVQSLIIAALLAGSGAQWFVLQSVAWTGMFLRYSQEATTLSEAIGMTFDGKNPCQLCSHIADAKPQPELPTSNTAPGHDTLKGILPKIVYTPPPSGQAFEHPAFQARASERSELPLTPPPRSGLRLA